MKHIQFTAIYQNILNMPKFVIRSVISAQNIESTATTTPTTPTTTMSGFYLITGFADLWVLGLVDLWI